MSIKTAIDRLTGESSKNIEDAISKIDLGGGGGSGGIMFVSETTSGSTVSLTKTFKEIYDCFDDGGFVAFVQKGDNSFYVGNIISVNIPSYEGQGYSITIQRGSNNFTYSCRTEDSYPSYEDE